MNHGLIADPRRYRPSPPTARSCGASWYGMKAQNGRDDRHHRTARLSRLSRRRPPVGGAGGDRRGPDDGAARHAADAEIRPSVHRAHVELRAAGLDLGRERLPLSADASGDRPALAADTGTGRRHMGCGCAISRTRRSAVSSTSTRPTAKMGLHQDRDEQEFDAPVVSISLGDSCLFRVGGRKRRDPTRSFRLNSGDVVVLGGDARLAFHGVDRIYAGTSTLLRQGGRINLTMRRVTRWPRPAGGQIPSA